MVNLPNVDLPEESPWNVSMDTSLYDRLFGTTMEQDISKETVVECGRRLYLVHHNKTRQGFHLPLPLNPVREFGDRTGECTVQFDPWKGLEENIYRAQERLDRRSSHVIRVSIGMASEYAMDPPRWRYVKGGEEVDPVTEPYLE